MGSHPAFAVPRKEMTWWVTLYPRYRHRRDAGSWQHFLDDLLNAESTRTLNLDRADLGLHLRELPPGSYLRAFDLVLSAHAEREGCKRWGEKTLLAEFYANDILRALPATKVIHLVRDPRDVFASYRHAPWRTAVTGLRAKTSALLRGQMAWTLGNWSASARLARANLTRHPGRYFVLRYEDLVGNPQATLERVCAFLDESFEPQMLAMRAYPDLLARGGNSSFGRLEGISQTPVGRFPSLLAPREIALCEMLAGAEFQRHGYASAGVRLGRSETLRLHALDKPWSGLIGFVQANAFRVKGVPRA
jgi:hypothetical protein